MNLNKELEVFNKINFDPNKHIYTVGGVQYKSATTLIGEYKQKWNMSKKNIDTSIEDGISIKLVEDINRIKLKYYGLAGTEFHLYAEIWIDHKRKYIPTANLKNQIKEFHRFYDTFSKRCDIVETEIIVGDDDWKVAGTIDCIGLDRKEGSYILFDWKTTSYIETVNKYNEFMLPPLQKIPNINLYEYCLQLTLYKMILEKNINIKIKRCFIVHFPPATSFDIISVENVEEELKKVLNEIVRN